MPDGPGGGVFSARNSSQPQQRGGAGPAKLRGATANYVTAEAIAHDQLLKNLSAGLGEPDS